MARQDSRPTDHRPIYCLNQVGVPKRPEIKTADFAKALEGEPAAIIPFDPSTFGTAANNGQMIAEVSSAHRVAEIFRQLAHLVTGKVEAKKAKAGLLPPLLGKLMELEAATKLFITAGIAMWVVGPALIQRALYGRVGAAPPSRNVFNNRTAASSFPKPHQPGSCSTLDLSCSIFRLPNPSRRMRALRAT